MAPGTRLGRPREFQERVRFMVLLERRELAALRRRASSSGLSASAFARAAIVAAIAAKRHPRPPR
jgi:hypothetical protein